MAAETYIDVQSAQGHRRVRVAPSMTLCDALRLAGTPLNMRCGGRGLCDGCIVELIRGSVIRQTTGATIHASDFPLPIRGCEHSPAGEALMIRIPPRSLLAYQPQIVTDFRVNVSRGSDPLWQEIEIAPAEDLESAAGILRQKLDLDWPIVVEDERRVGVLAHECAEDKDTRGQRDKEKGEGDGDVILRGVLRPEGSGIEVEEAFQGDEPRTSLPDPSSPPLLRMTTTPQSAIGNRQSAIRQHCYALLQRRPTHWALTSLSSSREPRPLGVAIDIGTTTVAVLLVELESGNVVGRAAQFNRQMQLGDDVLTRIHLCINDEKAVAELQKAIVAQTIAPLLNEALAQAGAPSGKIKCIVLAGNTTMLHLLAGVNPASMGTAPFTPVFLNHRVLCASEIPCWPPDLAPSCPLHLLPGPAAYVGADLSAGMLSSGLLYDEGPSLLVDVGTNGEIILKHGQHVAGCATAAGPAFEGAGLSCGVRAGDGAIGHLRIAEDQVDVDIIGASRRKPIGICGSGYIDFLGEARRVGLLNEVGRFDPPADHPLINRLIPINGAGKGFVIAYGEGKRPILITEADIARLLPAKAAIAAGVLTLLQRKNLTPADVKKVYLAGGFGIHMSASHAIACGLLPGFVTGQIQPVGNSALAGAYLALLDSTALDAIARACQGMEIVELNLDPGFEMRYIEQMMMP